MPSWKKVITSGSDATLNSLFASTSITASIFSGSQFTGSLFGTASWATNAISASFSFTASYILNAVSASFASTASYILTASYARTASNIEGGAPNYITMWSGSTSLTSSIIYQSASRVAIGAGATLPGGTLVVKGAGATSGKTLILQNSTPSDTVTVFDNGNVNIGFTTDQGYKLAVSGAAQVGSSTVGASHILGTSNTSIVWSANNFAVGSAIPIRSVIVNPNGTYASLTGTRNTFVGYRAGSDTTTGNNNTFIGNDAGLGVTTGVSNVVITGQGATTTGLPAGTSNSVTLATEYRALDASYMPTSKYAFIGGGFNASVSVRDFFFGQVPFTADAASVGITFYSPAGSGSDVGGAPFTIAAGRGTGIGLPADLIFQTSTTGSSGATVQTLSDRVRIKGQTGNVIIGSATGLDTGSFRLNVSGSSNFIGNVITSGSFTVFTGSAIEFQVTNTGTKIGNAITDLHTVTGSFRVSGSVFLSGLVSQSQPNVVAIDSASGQLYYVNTASFGGGGGLSGGATNYIPLWASATTLTSSLMFQTSSRIGVNILVPSASFHISGTLANGLNVSASGLGSHAQGDTTIASARASHAEGAFTRATGEYSHAEGWNTLAVNTSDHAEGFFTTASGAYSHAEGYYTYAGTTYSHAEGANTVSAGVSSHAEGSFTSASGISSHAEGNNTRANGDFSHTEGHNTIASGYASHTEGYYTTASGDYSHAAGNFTVASGNYQSVIGTYNISSSNAHAFIIGNGTSAARRNLLYASQSRIEISGSLTVSSSLAVGGIAPSATVGRIDASNDVVAFSTSDERLKENIRPIENAIQKINSISGIQFDWKSKYKPIHGYEGNDVGVIAQEIEKVLPEALRKNNTGYLAVRYEKIIPLLIEAIKEQQKQINELKAKIDGITS